MVQGSGVSTDSMDFAVQDFQQVPDSKTLIPKLKWP